MAEINLDGAYQNLKEELPIPWKGDCTDCGVTMITELHVSYLPEKQDRIKLYRPAHCPDCASKHDPFIKLIGELAKDGKVYPKDKEGRVK